MIIDSYTIDRQGWLTEADRLSSDNFNARPADIPISLLVIHNISLPPGQFGGTYVKDFFTNDLDCNKHPFFQEIVNLQVSAHLLIDRAGCVTQFVSFKDRAWHAGQSCYSGIEDCNNYSIGIELEGTDDEPYSNEQYESLSKVTDAIISHYPAISKQRIVGHSEIAPERKTDPGPAFDWSRYLASLGE